MEYVDFMPEETLAFNTNGVQIFSQLYGDSDPSILSQFTTSLYDMAYLGNSFFSALTNGLSGDMKKDNDFQVEAFKAIVSHLSEYITKDYDVTFVRTVTKERTTQIKVPKVRKVGLFKKEEYFEYETKTEQYTDNEAVTNKGWLLERFYRRLAVHGGSTTTMFVDYCLGADGEMYIVLSMDGSDRRTVLKCVYFTPMLLNNKFSNIYVTLLSGVIGALDYIPIDNTNPVRNAHYNMDGDDYYCNFPIQIGDVKSFEYDFLFGTIHRVVNLLSESDRTECIKKYSELGTLFK